MTADDRITPGAPLDAPRLVRAQGVTAPLGFRAAGIAAGIKASGAPDLALVFNEGPEYAAAGVFTRNQVQAAPEYKEDKPVVVLGASGDLESLPFQ